jgi:8-oxo-dGTP pyrophosphatase MutT (NUDIX family)
LLISSSRNKNFWVIPGGGIEDNENPEDAAEREVYEEAGVQGRLGRLLGIFEVFEVFNLKHVELYIHFNLMLHIKSHFSLNLMLNSIISKLTLHNLF